MQREQEQARQQELLAGSLPERLQQRLGSPADVADFLQPFIQCPVTALLPLLDSLGAWVAHQGNLSAAAKALGCHRNSLRYRLDKLLRLTGLDPQQAADQHTLILLHALLAEWPRASARLETAP